eukprot:COSAG01_NODE_5549_length_4191_cov_3.120235_1_plen_137_part_00
MSAFCCALLPPHMLTPPAHAPPWSRRGYGDISSYPNPCKRRIQTPNVAKLAEQGMRFTDACAPSRAAQPSSSLVLYMSCTATAFAGVDLCVATVPVCRCWLFRLCPIPAHPNGVSRPTAPIHAQLILLQGKIGFSL